MPGQTTQTPEGPTWLTMPDIANLAGVKRPVISTWRRRHLNFPAPAHRRGSVPLFDAREVCDWLVSTGRAERRQLEPDLQLHALASLEEALPARSLVATCTALICLRFLDDEMLATGKGLDALRDRAAAIDSVDDMLLSEVCAIPNELSWICRFVDELIESAWGCAPAFDQLLSSRERLGATELTDHALDNELARLVAGLSNAREYAALNGSLVISDPNAGPGDLLTAVAEIVGDDVSPAFVAAEPDPYLARLTRRRLTVRDVPLFDQDIRIGTELPDDEDSSPDVIVTQVAYRPGESRSAADVFQQIDDISLRLGKNRTAVVLGPAAVLAGPMRAHSPEEAERERLLRSETVEAIIRLPGGLVPLRPGYETALWVMTPAYTSALRHHVLVADVSEQRLSSDIVDQLIEDVATWRREGFRPDAHQRGLCLQTPVADLVGTARPITSPIRPEAEQVGRIADEVVAQIAAVEKELQTLGEEALTPRPAIRANAARVATRRARTTTVRALIKARQVRLVKGSRVATEHLIADGQHPVVGISGDLTVDRLTLAKHYPQAYLTEPGDVIVTSNPGVCVTVDRRGLSVVAFPARALRLVNDDAEGLTPQVLAALLQHSHGGRRAGGAVRAGWRLEDWQLQIPDRTSLARLDALLTEIHERCASAQAQLDALDELSRLTVVGLTDGTITLQQ